MCGKRTLQTHCSLALPRFLHKNSLLAKDDGKLRITNDGLAALTILIAESKPEEKEIMVTVAMNMKGN